MSNILKTLTKNNNSNHNNTRKFLFNWIIPIVIAIVLSLFIKQFVVFAVEVPTPSMAPTVNPGDHFFVTKLYSQKSLNRYDIVVFKSNETDKPNELLMKRVIGLPGDKIVIKNDGKLFINGEETLESYVKNPSNKEASFNVPQGKYVVLGDNRANSHDSRFFNNPYVDFSDIEGIVKIKIFPFNEIKLNYNLVCNYIQIFFKFISDFFKCATIGKS